MKSGTIIIAQWSGYEREEDGEYCKKECIDVDVGVGYEFKYIFYIDEEDDYWHSIDIRIYIDNWESIGEEGQNKVSKIIDRIITSGDITSY